MNSGPVIKILRLRPVTDSDIPLPRYMTSNSAGMDLCAAIKHELVLDRGELTLIPTGFAIALPQGYEAQIRPRSGLAITHGIGLINSPGTIDTDYRGEIKVALINLGPKPYTIHRGDRIAQMVFAKVEEARWVEVEDLSESARGDGGFGHTGG